MKIYHELSKALEQRILEDRAGHAVNPYAFDDKDIVRKYPEHDKATIVRPAFVRDVEKIMHNPYYNRYSDKTQVFSLLKNDDITRRSQHVQQVARIARNIGSLLMLNTDLIEAISLGHDIGHTPFGHAGERKLNELSMEYNKRAFNHNIQSARVFTTIFPVNLSLQTLDGIICHNGELELQKYAPAPYYDFETLENKIENTYTHPEAIDHMIPATLEGCVMRVADIIAYLGKDRQDAMKLGIIDNLNILGNDKIGYSNAEIINNMIVNIVERSYGQNYISMDPEFFEAFKTGKADNYKYIYSTDKNNEVFENTIFPLFEVVFNSLLKDIKERNENSVIYKHHINYIKELSKYYPGRVNYEDEDPAAVVIDYMASMTDDYLIDLYEYLFPKGKLKVEYIGYF